MSLAALKGGAASVLSIDSSAPSMAMGSAMVAKNGLDSARAGGWTQTCSLLCANCAIRPHIRSGDSRPAEIRAHRAPRREGGARVQGHQFARLQALEPRWIFDDVFVFRGVSADLFQKIVAGAALDAKVDAQILRRLNAGIDHPVAVHFPEGTTLRDCC